MLRLPVQNLHVPFKVRNENIKSMTSKKYACMTDKKYAYDRHESMLIKQTRRYAGMTDKKA